MGGATAIPLTAAARLADYVELCKPRLSLMVVLTSGFGFYLAGGSGAPALAAALAGTLLASAGAAAVNMAMEHEADGLMTRTRRRPIPAGRLSPGEAVVFGLSLAALGTAVLALWADPLAALLAVVTVVVYLLAYTPLKRLSPLATPVGAISGALPPMIGWAAAGHGLSAGAWVLFAILFLWQIPHFLAIAWLYREDYGRAGMPVLPVVEPAGGAVARQMILHTLALIVVSLAPYFRAEAGPLYLAAALLLGAGFLACGIGFMARRTTACARAVFIASLIYLPALLALMSGGV